MARHRHHTEYIAWKWAVRREWRGPPQSFLVTVTVHTRQTESHQDLNKKQACRCETPKKETSFFVISEPKSSLTWAWRLNVSCTGLFHSLCIWSTGSQTHFKEAKGSEAANAVPTKHVLRILHPWSETPWSKLSRYLFCGQKEHFFFSVLIHVIGGRECFNPSNHEHPNNLHCSTTLSQEITGIFGQ